MLRAVRLFPPVESKPAYSALLRAPGALRAGVVEIARRHGVAVASLEPLAIRSNPVWASGSRVIKAVPPLWPREARAERAMLEAVEGRLGIETPRLDAAGEIDGWGYVVMSRIEGRSAEDVWERVPEPDRRLAFEDLGRALARLHALVVPDLAAIERWPDVVATQRAAWAATQRERGLSEAWVAEGEAFLSRAVAEVAGLPTVPVHADLTWEHVLFRERDGRWRATGLLDFADAMQAPRELELVMPSSHWIPGRRDLVRAWFLAYGLPESALSDALSDRLLAFALLHRFLRVPEELARSGGLAAVRDRFYALRAAADHSSSTTLQST
jgi:hygromycin-B 7''-O-kinase